MGALLQKLMQRLPFKGNLVTTHYLIGNPKIGIPMRKTSCRSVILKNTHNDTDALIVSNLELTEANCRFVKYIKTLGEDASSASSDPGLLKVIRLRPSKRFNKTVEYRLVYFSGWFENLPGAQTGFLFTMSDLDAIVNRTNRVMSSVVRPNFFQRWLINLLELED